MEETREVEILELIQEPVFGLGDVLSRADVAVEVVQAFLAWV